MRLFDLPEEPKPPKPKPKKPYVRMRQCWMCRKKFKQLYKLKHCYYCEDCFNILK